ncbi:hypothetical protein NPIL_490021 [Nephila pilipes]|uniref:Uncharacterized protein n=1 Tax=Nephila pilipes TaxID=299642 RepID=A0A8X6UCJ3_NEPPI|nr:hypothetical protein NPIL_490021 [Nephila pilipes]
MQIQIVLQNRKAKDFVSLYFSIYHLPFNQLEIPFLVYCFSVARSLYSRPSNPNQHTLETFRQKGQRLRHLCPKVSNQSLKRVLTRGRWCHDMQREVTLLLTGKIHGMAERNSRKMNEYDSPDLK